MTDEEKEQQRLAAEEVRTGRKLDIYDALGRCNSEGQKITTLKPGKRTKKEVFLGTIGDPDNKQPTDVIILDGERLGTALYVAQKQDFEKAIDMVNIKSLDGNKELTAEDKLYHIFKEHKSLLREIGIEYIIHSKNKDMAEEIKKAVEKVAEPVGDLEVDHDI